MRIEKIWTKILGFSVGQKVKLLHGLGYGVKTGVIVRVENSNSLIFYIIRLRKNFNISLLEEEFQAI